MKRTLVLLLALALLAAPLTALQQDVNISDDPLLAQWLQLGQQLRENGTYPYVELRREDRGYEVIALQTRLFQLNYYDKDIVPVFGTGTEAAMRRFEKANALRVNGWASVEDQRLLFQSAALAAPGTTPKPQTEGAGTAPPAPDRRPADAVGCITHRQAAVYPAAGTAADRPARRDRNGNPCPDGQDPGHVQAAQAHHPGAHRGPHPVPAGAEHAGAKVDCPAADDPQTGTGQAGHSRPAVNPHTTRQSAAYG